MEIKVNGKENNCEHSLQLIDSSVKWCKKCGMIQRDSYNIDFVLVKREQYFPENK